MRSTFLGERSRTAKLGGCLVSNYSPTPFLRFGLWPFSWTIGVEMAGLSLGYGSGTRVTAVSSSYLDDALLAGLASCPRRRDRVAPGASRHLETPVRARRGGPLSSGTQRQRISQHLIAQPPSSLAAPPKDRREAAIHGAPCVRHFHPPPTSHGNVMRHAGRGSRTGNDRPPAELIAS